MRTLASTMNQKIFGRLIFELAQASLDGASVPVTTLIKQFRHLQEEVRADGLGQCTVDAIVAGRRMLGDHSAI
ncbi:hypothetical protein [Methylobacterium nigriterrae]|uniref:hypothetical protein n=1 Tax=Methylobacterium nigriterrae TaxID=3127512 RepID=UPI0030132309